VEYLRAKNKGKVCSVEGCNNPAKSKGMCSKHYSRFWRYGDTSVVKIKPRGAGCIDRSGYKKIGVGGAVRWEHIVVAEKAHGGELPKGAVVHHVNGNRADNRNENLVICQDATYHALLHIRKSAIDACGNPDFRKCDICKRYDEPNKMLSWFSKPNSATPNYRHRECNKAKSRETNERIRKRKAECKRLKEAG
jgi:hypothetical protein